MMAAVFTMAYVGCSRLGRIKLGTDDEEPEFGMFSWVAMMFGAGIGVGIFFYGPLRAALSLPHAPAPHRLRFHRRGAASVHGAGALPLGAVPVGRLRPRGRSHRVLVLPPRPRAARVLHLQAAVRLPRHRRPLGTLIDALALVATLFGTAATLGLSAIQIGQGVSIIRGAGPLTNSALIIIIAILGCGFIISAVSGVSRGVRYLSNINITFTLALIAFVFLAGPTLFLLNLIPSGILTYLDQLLPMMAKGLSWGDETIEFQSYWTAFYWAWWIAWTPFVGMFVARISRGRTIREFTVVTVFAPTLILILAFTIFGGTSISFNREGLAGFDGSASGEQVLFDMFGNLPLHQVTPFILLFVLAVFFITSADSASVIMGTMSTKGDPAPNKLIVIFWGLCMMGIAIVMLLVGGEDVLTGLQNLTILAALPFCVVLLVMMVAFIKDLRSDPLYIRRTYALSLIHI